MSSQLNRDLEKLDNRTLFDRTFRDREGRIVIAQMPNLPVLVGIAAIALQFVLPSDIRPTLGLVAVGALFTWAWQELFDGVNYFRRSLGLIGLVGLLTFGLNLIRG